MYRLLGGTTRVPETASNAAPTIAPTRHAGLVHEPSRRTGDDERDEWRTPPEFFRALGLDFDLDPCGPADGYCCVPATRQFTRADDGLSQDWQGRVFVNPPYGSAIPVWLTRLEMHGNGVALVFSRTDTAWFHTYARQADALLFTRGRLHFLRPDGSLPQHGPGAGSLVLAYGRTCASALAKSGLGLCLVAHD